MTKRYLVVGAGLSGATFARVLHDAGHIVHVIDSRDHVGGNVFDEEKNGMYRHVYGPHLFHTNSRRVVDFLSRFTEWHPYTHRVKAEVHGQQVDIPVNLRTIEQLYPPAEACKLQDALVAKYQFNSKVTLQTLIADDDPLLQAFGEFVKENFVENYSAKAWGTDVFKLDPEILKRIPVRVNYDDRYFEDTFQAQPADGFTPMVTSMLDGIRLSLGVKYHPVLAEHYDRIYYTGTIDGLLNRRLGPLPYRGLDFIWSARNPDIQNEVVVNHPHDMLMTRTTNFGNPSGLTGNAWFCSEIPRAYNPDDPSDVPYYPVRSEESRAQYRRYCELAEAEYPAFIFGGRLGRFEYLNMDQAVAQALSLAAKELG